MMIAVALAAILLQVERTRRIKKYGAAAQRLEAQTVFYENGTIGIERYLDASRRLMEAELALCWTRAEKIAVMKVHLARAESAFYKEETRYLVGTSLPDYYEAAEFISEDQARLDKLTEAWWPLCFGPGLGTGAGSSPEAK